MLGKKWVPLGFFEGSYLTKALLLDFPNLKNLKKLKNPVWFLMLFFDVVMIFFLRLQHAVLLFMGFKIPKALPSLPRVCFNFMMETFYSLFYTSRRNG